MNNMTNQNLAIHTLKKERYEYYLYAMLAPASAQNSLIALLSFEWELEQILHKVSEEMLGYIRFTWWRETLEMLESGNCARTHPVIDALKDGLSTETLDIKTLKTRLIKHEQHFAHQHEIDGTCQHTVADLMLICASIITKTSGQLQAGRWVKRATMIQQHSSAKTVSPKSIMLLLKLFLS